MKSPRRKPGRKAPLPSVGRNVPRKEGVSKVTGAARYIDDISFPGMLHGMTIRSTVPCGEVLSVRLDFDLAGFTVADHRDIPGRNVVALIEDDQPCLVEKSVRHAAEPILLLAHEDRDALLQAKVDIRYAPGTPIFDPAVSPLTFKTIRIAKGDLARGFRAADRVIEGEYTVGHQEQLYIETNGVIAVPENGGITVYGSMQCPYYVHKALTVLLGLAPEKVRVVQTETGGGFGGKEEYPSMIALHAALLALKCHKPVRMIYDRHEDISATTKRHPAVVRYRSGVGATGELVAQEIEVIMDGGAYCTLTPVVLSRGTDGGGDLAQDASVRAAMVGVGELDRPDRTLEPAALGDLLHPLEEDGIGLGDLVHDLLSLGLIHGNDQVGPQYLASVERA